MPELHHLHRRRPRDPAVPRVSDRAAGGPGELPRGGLPPVRRRAAEPDRSWTASSTTSRYHTYVHTKLIQFLDGFRYDAHPMGMLLGAVGALSTFYPDAKDVSDPANRYIQRVRLIAKLPTIAAFVFRHSRGLPYEFPRNDLELHRQFRQHDLQHRRPAQGQPGAAAGARDPADPSCRPRAELLDQRGAGRRVLRGGPVLGRFGRDRRALRPAARRRQRGSAPHAGRDRRQEAHPGLHRAGEGGRRDD